MLPRSFDFNPSSPDPLDKSFQNEEDEEDESGDECKEKDEPFSMEKITERCVRLEYKRRRQQRRLRRRMEAFERDARRAKAQARWKRLRRLVTVLSIMRALGSGKPRNIRALTSVLQTPAGERTAQDVEFIVERTQSLSCFKSNPPTQQQLEELAQSYTLREFR